MTAFTSPSASGSSYSYHSYPMSSFQHPNQQSQYYSGPSQPPHQSYQPPAPPPPVSATATTAAVPAYLPPDPELLYTPPELYDQSDPYLNSHPSLITYFPSYTQGIHDPPPTPIMVPHLPPQIETAFSDGFDMNWDGSGMGMDLSVGMGMNMGMGMNHGEGLSILAEGSMLQEYGPGKMVQQVAELGMKDGLLEQATRTAFSWTNLYDNQPKEPSGSGSVTPDERYDVGHNKMERDPSSSSSGDAGMRWENSGSFLESSKETTPKTSATPSGVEAEVRQLETSLKDLIQFITPFAATPSRPNPEKPPPYLLTHFARLSQSIWKVLVSLEPRVHPVLSGTYIPPPPPPRHSPKSKSSTRPRRSGRPEVQRSNSQKGTIKLDVRDKAAEEEMAQLRARREELIASKTERLSVNPPFPEDRTIWRRYGDYQLPSPADTSSVSGSSTPLNLSRPGVGQLVSLGGQGGAKRKLGIGEGGDGVAVRRCLSCGVCDTPEWRRGPDGPRTLCNSCGLHFAKSWKKMKSDTEGPVRLSE